MSNQIKNDAFLTPEWVKHAVFYQIFPERFENGDRANDPENVQPWGTPPTSNNFLGGDLRGIIKRLDYLADLGITAIYLNPIFQASSNHKYNTYNYYRIDPHFGNLATFHELIEQAHRKDIRIILDGVFNHCGRGFFAFHDLLENGQASPYANWFHVRSWPVNAYVDQVPPNYRCWWNVRSLPEFNTDHGPVRRYLLDVARYWIEQGADGWRLDVPNEIADHDFWREFRRVVKQTNPDAYIVGEIWEDAQPWLDGTQFDAVMNYLLRDLCRDFLAHERIDSHTFATGVEDLLQRYPQEATQAQLNLLGSHDTARFLTEAGGAVHKLFPTILLQMSLPGAPCIYYGDEIGMAGEKDPHCRACFPWERGAWNEQVYSWVRRCIALRHRYPALRTGAFRTLRAAPATRLYAFARWDEEHRIVVVLNPDERPASINLSCPEVLPGEGSLRDAVSGTSYRLHQGTIESIKLDAWGSALLVHA